MKTHLENVKEITRKWRLRGFFIFLETKQEKENDRGNEIIFFKKKPVACTVAADRARMINTKNL